MDKLITESMFDMFIISLSGILINTLQSDMQALLYDMKIHVCIYRAERGLRDIDCTNR